MDFPLIALPDLIPSGPKSRLKSMVDGPGKGKIEFTDMLKVFFVRVTEGAGSFKAEQFFPGKASEILFGEDVGVGVADLSPKSNTRMPEKGRLTGLRNPKGLQKGSKEKFGCRSIGGELSGELTEENAIIAVMGQEKVSEKDTGLRTGGASDAEELKDRIGENPDGGVCIQMHRSGVSDEQSWEAQKILALRKSPDVGRKISVMEGSLRQDGISELPTSVGIEREDISGEKVVFPEGEGRGVEETTKRIAERVMDAPILSLEGNDGQGLEEKRKRLTLPRSVSMADVLSNVRSQNRRDEILDASSSPVAVKEETSMEASNFGTGKARSQVVSGALVDRVAVDDKNGLREGGILKGRRGVSRQVDEVEGFLRQAGGSGEKVTEKGVNIRTGALPSVEILGKRVGENARGGTDLQVDRVEVNSEKGLAENAIWEWKEDDDVSSRTIAMEGPLEKIVQKSGEMFVASSSKEEATAKEAGVRLGEMSGRAEVDTFVSRLGVTDGKEWVEEQILDVEKNPADYRRVSKLQEPGVRGEATESRVESENSSVYPKDARLAERVSMEFHRVVLDRRAGGDSDKKVGSKGQSVLNAEVSQANEEGKLSARSKEAGGHLFQHDPGLKEEKRGMAFLGKSGFEKRIDQETVLRIPTSPLSSQATSSTALKGEQTVLYTVREFVLEQVVPSITRMVRQGETRVTIALKPDTLGKIRVELVSEKGVLEARFFVESDEVRGAIENSLPELKSALGRQGVQVEGFEVNVEREFSCPSDHQERLGREGRQGHPPEEKPSRGDILGGSERGFSWSPRYFGYNSIEFVA